MIFLRKQDRWILYFLWHNTHFNNNQYVNRNYLLLLTNRRKNPWKKKKAHKILSVYRVSNRYRPKVDPQFSYFEKKICICRAHFKVIGCLCPRPEKMLPENFIPYSFVLSEDLLSHHQVLYRAPRLSINTLFLETVLIKIERNQRTSETSLSHKQPINLHIINKTGINSDFCDTISHTNTVTNSL